MRASNSSVRRQILSRQAPQLQKPDNCPAATGSVIAMYQQDLCRHRVTRSKLRDAIRRESDLRREKDELILRNDILAKESEHRLLNGLQLIASLLTTQSRGAKNPEAVAQLCMAANRVATLARVHRHLHTLDKLEGVEFKQYLEKLCEDVSDMVSSESTKCSLCVEGAEINISRIAATPLAFIASELITNSIKYAEGRITVGLQSMPNGDAVLSVSDDGPGLPEAFDPTATHGLGMKIIAALARQIHGELSFAKGSHGQGTRCSVQFNPRP